MRSIVLLLSIGLIACSAIGCCSTGCGTGACSMGGNVGCGCGDATGNCGCDGSGGLLGGRAAARGCGRFGCGAGGRLCMGCRFGGHRGTPYTDTSMGDGGQMAGPASPHVGYPYYTTRGPRDFLVANPPSIGR